jgi:hypothetical protein
VSFQSRELRTHPRGLAHINFLKRAEREAPMTSDPVETARTARERLLARRRSLLDDVASMDRVSIDYAADLRIIQDAIDVVDKAIEEEHALQSKLYDEGSNRP